jgi:hypothetical protein
MSLIGSLYLSGHHWMNTRVEACPCPIRMPDVAAVPAGAGFRFREDVTVGLITAGALSRRRKLLCGLIFD